MLILPLLNVVAEYKCKNDLCYQITFIEKTLTIFEMLLILCVLFGTKVSTI